MSAFWLLVATVALGCVLVCSVPAPKQPRDWREDWCVPECWAAHGQDGPCEDCPARRAARK